MLNQLMHLVEIKKVPHTLLFAGPKESDKRAVALKFAAALLMSEKKQHPDLHFYEPDSSGGMHTIEAMRALINEVHIAPYEASAKVFIIEDADKMLPTSSNALLKTLEEPSAHCYIILLATRLDAILPTIISRARTFTFKAQEKKPIERTEKRDLLVSMLSRKLSYADFMKGSTSFSEEEFSEQILEEILHWNRDRHLLAAGGDLSKLYFSAYKEELIACTFKLAPLEQIFDQIEKARFALQQHVNLRNCLDLIIHDQ